MRRDAFAQRIQVVATLQRGNDAPIRVAIGELAQALRDPRVIGGDKLQLRQRVAGVGVEAPPPSERKGSMRSIGGFPSPFGRRGGRPNA